MSGRSVTTLSKITLVGLFFSPRTPNQKYFSLGIPSPSATSTKPPGPWTFLLRSLDIFRNRSDSGCITSFTSRPRQEESEIEIIDAYQSL